MIFKIHCFKLNVRNDLETENNSNLDMLKWYKCYYTYFFYLKQAY